MNRLINGILHDRPMTLLALDSALAPAPTPAFDSAPIRVDMVDGEMEITLVVPSKSK
jgi:hypothetical protein